MARKKARRGYSARVAPPQRLDHTATRYRDRYSHLDQQENPPGWGGFSPSITRKTVRPLIRTVLEIPSTPQSFRNKRLASPVLPVRATIRSSDVSIRSPFNNATMLTPQLTERALICAKRNIRREVLFAYRKTRKGAGGAPRKPRSKVNC